MVISVRQRLSVFKFLNHKISPLCLLVFICAVFLTATSLLAQPSYGHSNVDNKIDNRVLIKKASGIHLPFIENIGQINNESVRFYANTFAGTVYITSKGNIVYNFLKTERGPQDTDIRQEHFESHNRLRVKGYAIKETIEGIKNAGIEGTMAATTRVNYFKGNKENWTSNITTWKNVSFGEVYSNIDLALSAYSNNVEKLFTVHPKGTVSEIRMKIEGAKGIHVNRDGDLEIETELGQIKMTKPLAYQEIGGKRIQVAADYAIYDNKLLARDSKLTYGFKVGEYDGTKDLVIDPLLASTFVGGGYDESGRGVAIDSSGNVFVAGYTNSSNFPTTPGAYDVSYNGNKDIFILKLDNTLSTPLAATFMGGSSNDSPSSIALDSSDNVYISGYTYSSNYPTTEGAYDSSHYDITYSDAFISKLDNTLSTLMASTYIGGRFYDYTYATVVDPSGNVLVSGATMSVNFPTTPGAFDTRHNDSGHYDVFVSKLDSTLTTLIASTFIGGNAADYGDSLAIDSFGNIFVAGMTCSSGYPTTWGVYNYYYNGDCDAFVSKLDSTLNSLLASTFIGSYNLDEGHAIAIDQTGDILIAGLTHYFHTPHFPTTAGAYDISHNGKDDVFVSRLDNRLNTLIASTYIGGSLYDYVCSMVVDQDGDIIIAGYTDSGNYPTTLDAYDVSLNGVNDVFVSKLDSTLSTLMTSTYIGGSADDHADSMIIDPAGNIFIVGDSNSTEYPTTPGTYDITHNGGTDVIISKLSFVSDVDNDGDGYAPDEGDCADNNPSVSPGVTEIWYDGIDQNCDGWNDYDGDMDTYVDSGWNDQSGGTSPGIDDCNDSDSVLNPATLWHPDFDLDGYGNPIVSLQQCTPPSDYILDNADCNDDDANIYPGGPAVRISRETPMYFPVLQTAYDSAGDGDNIQSQAGALSEDLNFNLSKSITLDGGYDCGYSSVTGKTIVNGTITINEGTVTIGNIEVL